MFVSGGLNLHKILRLLKFNLSPCLKPHIELNTRFRLNAVNDYGKNSLKVMKHAIFSKIIRKK